MKAARLEYYQTVFQQNLLLTDPRNSPLNNACSEHDAFCEGSITGIPLESVCSCSRDALSATGTLSWVVCVALRWIPSLTGLPRPSTWRGTPSQAAAGETFRNAMLSSQLDLLGVASPSFAIPQQPGVPRYRAVVAHEPSNLSLLWLCSGLQKGPAYCHLIQDNAATFAANTFRGISGEHRIHEEQDG